MFRSVATLSVLANLLSCGLGEAWYLMALSFMKT